jgi:hypothetical protein
MNKATHSINQLQTILRRAWVTSRLMFQLNFTIDARKAVPTSREQWAAIFNTPVLLE